MTSEHAQRNGRGRRFRPTLWASVFTVLALACLIGLGTWQLQRLEWKEALIATREAQLAQPPVDLPEDVSDPDRLAFLPVHATGRFLHEHEFHIGSRTHKDRVGFDIVTPLRLEDGRILLVNRGWVPAGRRSPETRPDSRPAGEVEVTGVLRGTGWGGSRWFRPDNDPAANYWFYVDAPAMARSAGLSDVIEGVYLEADSRTSTDPDALPIGGRSTRVDMRNDHLEYAITWYALALGLLVIYLLYGFRRGRPGEESS